MFPMYPDQQGGYGPPLPLMMGVIAGQQAMQRAAQEEQTALLEDQVFWTKWLDPTYQQAWAIDWLRSDWPTRFDIWEALCRETHNNHEKLTFVNSIIDYAVSEVLDDDEQVQYRADRDAEGARRAALKPTNTPRRKGWFRK